MDALEAEFLAYFHGQGIVTRVKKQPKPRHYLLWLDTSDFPPVPLERWALIAGDAVQNMRAALDHLAWRLALKKLGAEPDEKTARRIAFPVAFDQGEFPGRVNNLLDYEPLRKYQPYLRTNPERHPLGALNLLSNRDKHRTLNLVVIAIDEIDIKLTIDPGSINNLRFRRSVPFEHGAKIGTFSITTTVDLPHLDFDMPLAAYIASGDNIRVYGDKRSFLKTIRIIGGYVTKLIEREGRSL